MLAEKASGELLIVYLSSRFQSELSKVVWDADGDGGNDEQESFVLTVRVDFVQESTESKLSVEVLRDVELVPMLGWNGSDREPEFGGSVIAKILIGILNFLGGYQ